ncbi:MAG: macro domain-containing protein [Elusimicrobia bacterium]|nr:macro domain-containing protein [Elusimicrobiota bacterium]
MEVRIKGCTLEVCQGDLLAQKAEVLVCPTTEGVDLDRGLAWQVAKAAGPAFEKAAKLKAPLSLGVVTNCPPGNLPVRQVFLAAVTPKGSIPDRTAVLHATQNAVFLADQKGYTTIAFPMLGSVTTKSPYDTFGRLMLQAILEILTDQNCSLERVICCLYNRTAYQSFADQLSVLRQEFLI